MSVQFEKKPIPSIDFKNIDPSQDIEILKQAVNDYLTSGCLLLKGVYDENYISRLNDFFCEEYKSTLYADRPLFVGDKRIINTVNIDGPFNVPDFYAHPKLMPILQILLGDDLIVGGIGSVTSLPGAANQHIHRDNKVIFDDGLIGTEPIINIGKKNCISNLLPYAITVAIPLVNINESTGCTRSWPGTHLIDDDELYTTIFDISSGTDFTAERGDCFLFDYRLFHCGMENKSNILRPLIYNIYHRRWFRDTFNYLYQSPINLTDENYRKIPKKYRALFSWARPGFEAIDKEEDKSPGRNDPCPCGSGLRYKNCHGTL